jgi:hypothetical protein
MRLKEERLMLKKGIIIDTMHIKIERECMYEDQRVDGMYFQVDSKDLIPCAYIFPIENREKVAEQLTILKAAKKTYEDIQANIYYKVFPTLR